MASTEMVQIAPLRSFIQPLTERIAVLSDDHMSIDFVKAIVIMHVTTHERLQHLILKLNEAKLPKLSEPRRAAATEVKGDRIYEFIVRHQVGEENGTTIDVYIRSESLLDLLRTVLADMCEIDLDEDKFSAEQSVFQALVTECEVCHSLTGFYPVDSEYPENLYIYLKFLEGFEYSRPGIDDSVVDSIGL